MSTTAPSPAVCTCPGTRDLVMSAIAGSLPPCPIHRTEQTGTPVPNIPLNADDQLAASIGAALGRGRRSL